NVTNNAATTLGTTTLTGGLTITSAGTLAFNGVTGVGGALTATSVGNITQTAAVSVTGTSTFTAGGNDVTLTNTANAFTGAIGFVSVNNANITNNTATVLAGSNLPGTLTVTSAGAVSQTGVLTVGGAASFTDNGGSLVLGLANHFNGTLA